MDTKDPKKPKLTVKEAKLVNAVAQGKKKREAARIAGYSGSPETLSVTASEVLKKPKVQEALQAALIKHGIDIDNAVAPIGKGLKATKWNDFTGEREDDVKTQMQASDRALKLLGVKMDEGQGNTYNFVNIVQEQKDKYGI